MNILPQILNNSSKNLIIDNFINFFKEKLNVLFNDTNNYIGYNRYLDLILNLQKLNNDLSVNLLSNFFESIDNIFRNSKERKNNYYINKSNVSRTIVTIFGPITFKRTLYQNKITKEYCFYVDDIFNLEPYKTYDPLVRGILVEESTISNPNNVSKNSSLNKLSIKDYLLYNNTIPKSTVYNFKQETNIRQINYDFISDVSHLYVMVDEKWIHEQDKNNPNKKKWIMSKCFVTFTGINKKGKRNRLENRHIFITTSNEPWKEFMNEISNIYDFEHINNISLLSDAGSWILSGYKELKLYSNNKITVNTCEFHVKQKINRSTTDKDLRNTIANIIYEKENKKEFIKEMDKLIESKTKESRKQKITEYKNYILKHWKGIINMKHSICKSSMEAHIEHCIASSFSSIPKAYSQKNIEIYIKLQEMKLNDINILDYYLNTYNSSEDCIYNKGKEVNYSLFEKSTSLIPILYSNSNVANALRGLLG